MKRGDRYVRVRTPREQQIAEDLAAEMAVDTAFNLPDAEYAAFCPMV